MATNKIYKIVCASIIASAVCVGIPSCTDDHFDVDMSGGAGGNATLTLWQQIDTLSELSNFATLLSNTPCYKDETHIIKKEDGSAYTLKDILQEGTQPMTVFAPTNSAFTSDELQEALADLANPGSAYYTYLKLAGNHIARYRYIGSGDKKEEMVTINGKKAVFDRGAKTFKGLPLVKSNIGATNGTLHTINALAPFNYNFDQFIRLDSRFTHLRDWIEAHDTIYFNEALSAESGSDANGNPIYVDSIYTKSNLLYNYFDYEEPNKDWLMAHKTFRAFINDEDSVWAMALPTDAAWEAATEDLAKYLKYAPGYVDKSEENNFTNSSSKAKTIKCNPDTIQELATQMELASALVFNLRQQPREQGAPFWTPETFVAATEMPRMFNTRLDTFYIKTPEGEVDEHADVRTWIFQGVQPETMSNGLAYPINKWPFWDGDKTKDLDIKMSMAQLFQANNMGSTQVDYHSFISANSKLSTDSLLGTISDNYFLHFRNGTSQPTIQVKLIDLTKRRQVLSDVTYKVGIVMVPDFFRNNTDSIVGDSLKNYISVSVRYANVSSATGNPTETNTTLATKATYHGNSVDTVWVGEFKFPYSYRNITDSYPVMTISSAARNSEVGNGKRYQHPFSIDRIVLRAKKE